MQITFAVVLRNVHFNVRWEMVIMSDAHQHLQIIRRQIQFTQPTAFYKFEITKAKITHSPQKNNKQVETKYNDSIIMHKTSPEQKTQNTLFSLKNLKTTFCKAVFP